MVETVGRKLQKERVARKLKIEEVAEATKIRPERIIDLEADEYGHFANLTYAKSFLATYAKFLGVDIQEELNHFQVSPTISLRDYHYPPPSVSKSILRPRGFSAKGFRVPPLVVALLVLVLLVGVPLFSYMAMHVSRLRSGGSEGRPAGDQAGVDTPTLAGVRPGASGPRDSSASPPQGTGSSVVGLAAPSPSVDQSSASPSAQPSSRMEDGVEVRRALPVEQGGSPAPSGTPGASPSPGLATEPQTKLELRALKRTWVKVTKDEQESEPVFDGFAVPEDQPIVVEGKRFWVKVQDKGAVEVRKNGQRVLDSSDGVVFD